MKIININYIKRLRDLEIINDYKNNNKIFKVFKFLVLVIRLFIFVYFV